MFVTREDFNELLRVVKDPNLLEMRQIVYIDFLKWLENLMTFLYALRDLECVSIDKPILSLLSLLEGRVGEKLETTFSTADYDAKLQSCHTEMDACHRDLEQERTQSTSWKLKYEKAREDVQTMKDKMVNSEKELEMLELARHKLETDLKDAEKVARDRELDRDRIRAKLGTREEELKKLSDALQREQEEKFNLSKRLIEAENKKQKAEKDLERVQANFQENQRKKEEDNARQEKTTDTEHRKQCEELNLEIITLKSIVDSHRVGQEVGEQKLNYQKLSRQFQLCEKQKGDLEIDFKTESNRVQQLNMELATHKTRVVKLEGENKRLNQDVKSLEEDVQMEQAMTKEKDQNYTMLQANSEAKFQEETRKQHNESIEALDEANHRYVEQRRGLEDKIRELVEETAKLKEQLLEQETALERYRDDEEAYIANIPMDNELKSIINEKTKEIASLNDKHIQRLEENDTLKQQLSTAIERLDECTHKMTLLAKNCKDTPKPVKRLQKAHRGMRDDTVLIDKIDFGTPPFEVHIPREPTTGPTEIVYEDRFKKLKRRASDERDTTSQEQWAAIVKLSEPVEWTTSPFVKSLVGTKKLSEKEMQKKSELMEELKKRKKLEIRSRK